MPVKHILKIVFQSTSPVWRTTLQNIRQQTRLRISIHVPRVEDDLQWAAHPLLKPISIHVPRVEDDHGRTHCEILSSISIHVPRVEDDKKLRAFVIRTLYFNPRPPCGGRPQIKNKLKALFDISIHVPRVEDDRQEIH